MRKACVADDRLVGRHGAAHKAGGEAGELKEVLHPDARVDACGMTGERDLLERGVASAFPHPTHRHVAARRTRLESGKADGGGEAQVIVRVDAQLEPVGPRQQARQTTSRLAGQPAAGAIRQAQPRDSLAP